MESRLPVAVVRRDVRPIGTSILVAMVLGAAVLVAVAVCGRNRRDWHSQIRFAVALGRLEEQNAIGTAPLLEEVRLDLARAPQFEAGGDRDELELAPWRQMRFHIASELETSISLCDRWYLDSTPLLLARDERGAVLCGPEGSIWGAIEQCDAEVHLGIDWDLRR